MKVYLILGGGYEGDGVTAIYSTKEKAMEALPYLNVSESHIEEFEIDLPNEGEKYEKFYYFNIRPNDQSWGNECYEKPSDIKWIKYGTFSSCSTPYQGYGRTPEEAKINAEKARDSAFPVWQISDNGVDVRHAHPSVIYRWEDISSMNCYAIHPDRNVCIIAIEEYKKSGKISEFLTVLNKS